MSTSLQINANRTNSQQSTGPRTESDELYLDLLAEHEPVTTTEELLVYKIAEQFWFGRRASVLMTQASDDKRLALMIRYLGAAGRMFLKCINELRKLQKERKLQEIGSASQTPKEAVEPTPADQVEKRRFASPLTETDPLPQKQAA